MGRGAWARLASAAALVVLLAACALSSGADAPDEYVLAFQVTDDRRAFVEEVEPLAEWIADHTGVPTQILTVQDDQAQITALATGQAHAAYMSGGAAWIGWSTFDLEAVAAEVRQADGRTSYIAGLWVLDDGLEIVEDLRGARSCHTGELTGTGMLVPIGYLLRHGYVDTEGLDLDDVAAVGHVRERFFSNSRIGGGYQGAFRCLSTGEGDVATGRDTAWDDFCGTDAADWCRPREDYRFLPGPDEADPDLPDGGLARVPSHPVMVSPHLAEPQRDELRQAFLSLADDAEGQVILADILGVADLVPVTAAEHLGPYGDVVEHVPGITDHYLDEVDRS